jgi:hypothetical protein
MNRALTVEDQTVTPRDIITPDHSADTIYRLGLGTLPLDTSIWYKDQERTIRALLPRRRVVGKDEYDQDILEPLAEYLPRVWPRLPIEVKGLIVTSGLQNAAFYRDALQDGIQLVVFRAYREGTWVVTMEQYSSGHGTDEDFRAWVRGIVSEDDSGYSASEASQLATTVLNLTWLEANQYEGLPKDIEEIFCDRQQYNRWRRLAGKLRRLIEAAAEMDDPEDMDEYRDQIQEIVDAAQDPTMGHDDLDEVGKQRPSSPPILAEELPGMDDMGRVQVVMTLTKLQRATLRSKLGRSLTYALKGEQVESNAWLVQYREQVDPKTGEIQYAERSHSDESGWSDWYTLDEKPVYNGRQEGAVVQDPELGLTYRMQWEQVS